MARKENARGQPTIWPEYSDESWGGHLRHRHGLDLARDQIAATIGTSAGTVRESWAGSQGTRCELGARNPAPARRRRRSNFSRSSAGSRRLFRVAAPKLSWPTTAGSPAIAARYIFPPRPESLNIVAQLCSLIQKICNAR